MTSRWVRVILGRPVCYNRVVALDGGGWRRATLLEVYRGLKRRTVAVKGDSGNEAHGKQRKDARVDAIRRKKKKNQDTAKQSGTNQRGTAGKGRYTKIIPRALDRGGGKNCVARRMRGGRRKLRSGLPWPRQQLGHVQWRRQVQSSNR